MMYKLTTVSRFTSISPIFCLVKDLYEDQGFEWFPFKSISEQFAPNELYQRVEVTLNLPFDMGVEQVELQIASHDLFTKYLKLLKIETMHSDRPTMHLKGGFYDSSKRYVFEFKLIIIGDKGSWKLTLVDILIN
jgi:hypothetical protein